MSQASDIAAGRLPPERLARNFQDLHPPLGQREARVAAERCLFCYDAPCVQACPTSIDIPLFIRQIGTGNPLGRDTATQASSVLAGEGLFKESKVKPAIRANDTSDIWMVRGGTYNKSPSRPFRSASLSRVMHGGSSGAQRTGTDLGLYSITFNNDLDADLRSMEAFAQFRADAAQHGFKYFLEVFNPNAGRDLTPDIMPHYVNDSIVRCLAGVSKADRPQFLKIAYNGPKALEELAGYDPGMVVGVLGGGAGTTRDCFELLAQSERYGARVALFGRKINLAEDPLTMIEMMRNVADGTVKPQEAVRAYHGVLAKKGIKPARSAEDDGAISEVVLKQAA